MRNVILKNRLFTTTVLASALAVSLGSGVAQAQDADEDVVVVGEEIEDEAVQDTIIITGSRLARPADNTVAVTTIGAEQIDSRAFTNPIEAIEEIPFVGLGTNLDGANTQFGDNSANPDILNLQTNRTLTLVNGRRFVSSNQATVFVPGNANGSQVDLTLINPSLIQSTDLVIGSGGSATYGADAVAGVVNIILKDDYEGLEGSARYGVTDRGDGDNYRFSLLGGKNFLDGRANITVAGEYFTTEGIRSDDDSRLSGQQLTFVTNPLNTGGSDGQPGSILLPGATNPLLSVNGAIVSGQRLFGSVSSVALPNSLATNFYNAGDPRAANLAAFAAAGVGTPFEFGQTAAGQAIDPALYLGSFGDPNLYFSVPNTDAATSAQFPFRAVPLQFNSAGDLVPYNVGNIFQPADQNTIQGGDGLPNGRFANVTSDQERITLNALTRFDVTDNITYRGEYYYADITSTSFNAPASNASTGGTTSGSRALPIYVDQNPFLSAQALATLDDLEAQGATLPTLNGERVVYLNRSLLDVTGVEENGSEAEFFRIVQSLEGEFEFMDRSFNWDVFALYGQVEQDNFGDELLDIEFALATDVVLDGGQAVCRQQTLGAPEDIADRNPGVAFIQSAVSGVPSQAAIDACQPLNLFGSGSPSQGANDYVTTQTLSRNESSQLGYGAQFGGELVEVPAGDILFSVQAEYRKEENEFIPGDVFGRGLARNTQGRGSQGESEFTEWGVELSIPLFGGDFTFPMMQGLVLDGAYREVKRDSQGGPFNFTSTANDSVFNIGGRYTPIDDLTFRASISEAIRSPSIVELFGAGVTGFSGLGRGNLNPCDADSIDGGPASGIRRTNCEAFAVTLGLDPATYLPTFQAPGGSAPAAGASNTGLENEKSESWTAGVIYEPSFIDGLTLTLDYYELDLTGEIGLTGLNFQCFDSETFPTEVIGGFNACEALIFAVEDTPGSGNFIVPSVNPITGQPIDPIANPGSPAQDNVPFTSTFSFFPTLNLGSTEVRSWYGTARYDFDLVDLLTLVDLPERDYGSVTLNASAYFLENFDDGNNPRAGEPGDPELSTVLQVTHQYNKLTHSLQWFRTSDVLENVLSTTPPLDQDVDFARPEFNTFNYNASYDLTDRWALQFVVNNIFDEELKPEAGLAGDTIGRRYVFGVRGRF